jgi:hypothetical protein
MKLSFKELQQISDAGHDWILKHYSPESELKILIYNL